MALKRITDRERFMRHVVLLDNGCWEWTANKNERRYGNFFIGSRKDFSRKNVRAHRFSYEEFVGKISDGLTIDHLCRNPSCVNPKHLEPVTIKENVLRGTSFCAKNSKKTHCPKKHELLGDNLYVYKGTRTCKKCKYDAMIKCYLKRKSLKSIEMVGG